MSAVGQVKGPARTCLDALLAHELAESRVRWLELEGASAAEMADAVSAAVVAREAYERAAVAWSKCAAEHKTEHKTPKPAAVHADDCGCYGCR